jgi:hypothetical protein
MPTLLYTVFLNLLLLHAAEHQYVIVSKPDYNRVPVLWKPGITVSRAMMEAAGEGYSWLPTRGEIIRGEMRIPINPQHAANKNGDDIKLLPGDTLDLSTRRFIP